MNLGVDEIYNLLHNNGPESVAHHIRENAAGVIGSLILLDHIVEAKKVYADEIAAGGTFSVLFFRYLEGLKSGKTVPAMPVRAKNFSKAIFKFVVNGMPIASKEQAQAKLEICEANECGYFDGSVCMHTKCGCFSKIKTFFLTENCPIDKW